MLEITGLHASYGTGEVLHGVDLRLQPGQIVAVVGANGAGKTTLLRTISGLLRPSAGQISVDGHPIEGRSASHIVRSGIMQVPEGRQIFAHLSVEDNLKMGAYVLSGPLSERIAAVLETFPDLSARLRNYAGSLSGGQQQMLAIGRGLMAQPRYLLLDEPSLGLAPQITQRIFEVIVSLKHRGLGVLLVEQNGRLALSVADFALVLERGSVTLSGTGRQLQDNRSVVERYLGVGEDLGRDLEQHKILVRSLASALGEPLPDAS